MYKHVRICKVLLIQYNNTVHQMGTVRLTHVNQSRAVAQTSLFPWKMRRKKSCSGGI